MCPELLAVPGPESARGVEAQPQAGGRMLHLEEVPHVRHLGRGHVAEAERVLEGVVLRDVEGRGWRQRGDGEGREKRGVSACGEDFGKGGRRGWPCESYALTSSLLPMGPRSDEKTKPACSNLDTSPAAAILAGAKL